MRRRAQWATLWLACAAALAGLVGGCQPVGDFLKTDRTRFLAPEKVVAQPTEGSLINPILDSIGPTDRSQEVVPNATFPREGDWEYTDEDYVLGPTDVVDVSVLDLFAEGLETVLRRQVSESGYIDLPLLRQRILAEGLTKEQLKRAIGDAYSPDILRNPTVSITIAAQRQNTFSILGAVNRPGTYNILRKDMRLLEALALAGGITQTHIRYLYVIRPAPAKRVRVEGGPGPLGGASGQDLPPLPPEDPAAPGAAGPAQPGTPAPTPATAPAGGDTDRALRELGEALPGSVPETRPAPPAPSAVPHLTELADEAAATGPAPQPVGNGDPPRPADAPRWIFTGGKWVRVTGPAETPPAAPQAPAAGSNAADPFGWRDADKSDMARIIAINLPQLRDGNPRMNVIVRDNDIVHVPTLEAGEFYVMGEVARPGVYTLTGRRITVKMAVAAAGNLSVMAWPENSILIRRIGNSQEQIIPLNLESIFRGQDPDLFLKPDDVVAVGTDVRSTFMLVIRNAFRMTYGFGFIYDRNFAEPLGTTPTSRRFTRL